MTDVFLRPGEYYVGGASSRVRTLLGSCVSMILWHPQRRVGAMSHSLLSSRGSSGDRSLDARYVDEAFSLILRDLKQLGIRPENCQAKLFGGGSMFPRHVFGVAVGARNAEAARQLMRENGIAVVAESLFGTGHRQLVFDIENGDVWMRQVDLQDDPFPREG